MLDQEFHKEWISERRCDQEFEQNNTKKRNGSSPYFLCRDRPTSQQLHSSLTKCFQSFCSHTHCTTTNDTKASSVKVEHKKTLSDVPCLDVRRSSSILHLRNRRVCAFASTVAHASGECRIDLQSIVATIGCPTCTEQPFSSRCSIILRSRPD